MEKKNGATDPSDHKAAGERHSPSIKTAAHKDGHAAPASDDVHKTPKKRRKVNHACVYCRRSHMTCDLERPCTRCIKRNIGHLCHDEPRDADTKKIKSTSGGSAVDEMDAQASSLDAASVATPTLMRPPSFDATASSAAAKSGFNAGALGTGRSLQLVPPSPIAGMQQPAAMNSGNMNQFAGFSDAWLTAQNHLHDMHSYNPNYMIAPEVTNEFNLLNDFLHSSLLDDGVLDDQSQLLRSGTQSDMLSGFPNSGDNNGDSSNNLLPPPASSAGSMLPPGAELGKGIQRPASVVPIDKARAFYFQAADPTGNDSPEERMNRVLRAKYDAGLLKPFNYIKGYARLHQYLDSHKVAPASKQSIKRQLDKFRPKFREKMQALTDMELLYVEMWFEKTLLEYDRVFSSMAVPACCWRRTGEIFRGNKEMAELIHVPVERLRDGKIALHEILTEESMVRYWEEFGTVAFDPDHDALLTACALKNPDDQSNDPIVRCCFALKIRRDDHKIPSLIIGNFLPHNPKPHE